MLGIAMLAEQRAWGTIGDWADAISKFAAAVAAISEFRKLHWGPMSLVEDQSVESAMVEFDKAVKSNDRAAQTFQSYRLAHACRNSLKRSWGVDVSSSSVKSRMNDDVSLKD